MTCPSDDVLLQLRLGELSVNETDTLSGHCSGCTRCRRVCAEHDQLLSDLSAAPTLEESAVAFTARVLAACDAAPEATPARGGRGWLLGTAGALAVAASVALVSLRDTPQIKSRGSATQHADSAFAELLFVREGIFYPVSQTALRAGDRLAVRCSNRSSQAMYLAVFARDAAQDVHWIYPRYVREDEDPSSIRVSAGVHDQLLDEVVEPEEPAAGTMHIFALMGERPLRVKEVEAQLAAHPDTSPRELWPGMHTQEWSASWNAR